MSKRLVIHGIYRNLFGRLDVLVKVGADAYQMVGPIDGEPRSGVMNAWIWRNAGLDFYTYTKVKVTNEVRAMLIEQEPTTNLA